MAIGIDEIDDDDIFEGEEGQEPQQEPLSYQSQESNDDDDSFMSDFLRSKGIDDPSRIKFEDENNNIIERNWNDLTREEQINILNTPLQHEVEDNNDLSDEEINLLTQIRQSGLTPSQYLEQIQGDQIVQEPTYKIDDLSDDEVYILDLESRVGELSDDDAAQALSVAKQNEDLFNKQVEGIRKEYKDREDYNTQQEQAQLEQQQQEAYNQYQDAVINAINNFNSVGNLDLNFEDSDKEELAEFMLSPDEAGNNYLYRALQDPETLVKAAWFILNGDEAFDSITDYFTNQIKIVSDNQYKKGYEEGRKGTKPSRPTVVIQNNKQNQRRQYNTIDDLDDED